MGGPTAKKNFKTGEVTLNPDALASCYKTSLDLMIKHGLKTIAFNCISTGIFGYPICEATAVALRTVRKWLSDPSNAKSVNLVVFCTYGDDTYVYQCMIPSFFPPQGAKIGSGGDDCLI